MFHLSGPSYANMRCAHAHARLHRHATQPCAAHATQFQSSCPCMRCCNLPQLRRSKACIVSCHMHACTRAAVHSEIEAKVRDLPHAAFWKGSVQARQGSCLLLLSCTTQAVGSHGSLRVWQDNTAQCTCWPGTCAAPKSITLAHTCTYF